MQQQNLKPENPSLEVAPTTSVTFAFSSGDLEL